MSVFGSAANALGIRDNNDIDVSMLLDGLEDTRDVKGAPFMLFWADGNAAWQHSPCADWALPASADFIMEPQTPPAQARLSRSWSGCSTRTLMCAARCSPSRVHAFP